MDSADSQKGACRKARRQLDAHVSGELDEPSERETRAHLKGCGPCAALLEERRRVRDLVRRAARAPQTPARLADSIRAMIRQG